MIDIPASGSRQLFGIWTFGRLICVCQQYLSITERFLSPVFPAPYPNVSFYPIFALTESGILWGFLFGLLLFCCFLFLFCFLIGVVRGELVTKLAAVDRVGKYAVTVIPYLGRGTLPAGSADWHGDSLTESVFVFAFVFWLDFVYSFPAKIWCTLETLKLKAQVTLLPFSMRIEKKIKQQTNKCACVYVRSCGPTGFTQEEFHFVFALQSICGAGVPASSCPLPTELTRSSEQFFLMYLINPVGFSLSFSGLQRRLLGRRVSTRSGACSMRWPRFSEHGPARQNPVEWEGCLWEQGKPQRQAAELGWPGGRSPQLPFPGARRNLPLRGGSRSADGRAAALGSRGVYNFSDCSGRWYPCWGGAPP